ncbi:MAG: Bcr/CflA family efflux MFS transporter [Desulfobacteraceae bacterium]|nr:MAG: Bcr/CflA family efflux MFS transporter [Desulfobacteraceae bacterium]
MAVIISITALAIDMMLPALPDIGTDLGLGHPNDAQLVISSLLFGFGMGQVIFGPLSDCFGRRPIIFIGFLIFILGCLMSFVSNRFEIMLAGRFIQGIGAAGPRTAIVALIRDRFGGRAMARIMSVIMAIFIFVPAIAPALGQVVLIVAGWRTIFMVLMIQGGIALTWFALRQPETLLPKDRLEFSLTRISKGLVEVSTNRVSLGYTLASGFISGALIGYLNSAQQVFQEVHGLGREFPVYMAFLALSVGGASFVNSRIVMRLGMRRLSWWAIGLFITLMSLYLSVTLVYGGHSPLWWMMGCLSLSFFCMGILFGNQNSIAMEPLAHIAGVGAAVIGCLSSLICSLLGMVVGRCYDGSTIPMAWGFVILGILTAAAMYWADHSEASV